MAYEIVDPAELMTDGAFFEDDFINNADRYDWEKFRDKTVLVRGCTSTLVPPWAYMLITGRLSSRAKSVRFGNEHDNIVVYRREN